MNSNQHPNKVSSHDETTNKSTSTQQAKKQDEMDDALNKSPDDSVTLAKQESMADGDTKHAMPPRRGRTYACSSIDEVAQAFELDIEEGKLIEKGTQ